MKKQIFFLSTILAFGSAIFIFSQTKTISREMEQAIRLYQEGKDNDAMDRFMDILVKGTPSEKALANEYINKITLRMNTGVNTVEDMQEKSPVQNISKPKEKKEEQYIEKGVVKEEETGDTKELIASKIRKKIEEMKKEALISVSNIKAFKVFMSGKNTPVAVLINNEEIFSSGANFKPQALDNLQTLASLIFTVGNASVVIIPKGAVTGEIEIANIRKAIAINSYLTSRGISPARLSVNLTGTDVNLPREVNNLDGTLCLLEYQKEPVLKSENDPKTQGPKVSLGIYPTAISVYKNEGAIIEFSVFEGDNGLPTWKFQIYQVLKDNSMLLMQEVNGEGPKYNQTFFNGREKFFGSPYPSGKYLFSVTATDLKGNKTTEKRLLLLKPSPEEEKKLAEMANKKIGKEIFSSEKKSTQQNLNKQTTKTPISKNKSTLIASKTKSKNLGKSSNQKSLSSGKLKSKKGNKNTKDTNKPETGNKTDASNGEEYTGQVVYKIYFEPGTLEITANSEKKLEQVVKTLENYPTTSLLITGYSHKQEENSKIIAKKRADSVKRILIDKYNVEQNRIKTTVKIESKLKKTIAEIRILQE